MIVNNVINIVNVKKNYGLLNVLNGINCSFETSKFYAIMGKSGSGKSTFINILGLLDCCDSGEYFFEKKDINKLTDKELCDIRMNNIGFVFQDFQLNDYMTAIENVMLPMIINKKILRKDRKNNALSLLKRMGLDNRINHFPSQLSGGEQQRVAIARALANDPKVILADEPTGNLDSDMEKEIFSILKEMSLNGKCVIVVSHSDIVKNYADEILYLKNKTIVGEKNEDN